MNFKKDTDKLLNASLYILGKIPSCDKHKLFKILYFAEREHLAEYGRPITGDAFKAIKYGPIPSYLTDAIKSLDGYNSFFNYEFEPSEYFELVSYYVGAKKSCNLDYLSESDISCLNNAITFLDGKSFEEITRLSHDEAWKVAYNDYDNTINPINMAASAGANFEMIKYIKSNIENHNSFACH